VPSIKEFLCFQNTIALIVFSNGIIIVIKLIVKSKGCLKLVSTRAHLMRIFQCYF